jgi:hypothetical protein
MVRLWLECVFTTQDCLVGFSLVMNLEYYDR